MAQSSSSENNTVPLWLRPDEKITPIWMRTFYASLPTTAVYIMSGSIHDLHPIPAGDKLRPDTTINAIWQVLEEADYRALLTFDPLNGLTIKRTAADCNESQVRQVLSSRTKSKLVDNLLRTTAERALQAADDPAAAEITYMGMDAIAGAVAQIGDPAMALVIDYTTQKRRPGGDTDNSGGADDPGLQQLLLASLMIANTHAFLNDEPVRFDWPGHNKRLRRPIIWLVDKPGDLPNWLTQGDGVQRIAIGAPDVDTRKRVASMLVANQVEPQKLDELSSRFANATEGFTVRGMYETVQLARGTLNNDIEGAIRTYRQGLSDNPWQSMRLVEALANGEAILERRVQGQSDAVSRVLDILRRSTLGLTGAHQRKVATAPRGVLFFAGPTGTGKTEMAKTIAELVFADEKALIRFDMSEFKEDHARSRLIGAPPGYIGYGAGGELTNAVNERPHAIILFDEMEKAHPEVFDLFLQILSDGRLTDSAGNTVLFNEALIVFTSNIGVVAAGGLLKEDLSDSKKADEYEEAFRQAVENHFINVMHRPELLGRLGKDNIVVFRPMQGKIARDVADGFIDAIIDNVSSRVCKLVISDEARAAILDEITEQKHLSNGARGIISALETVLINPLSRLLFGCNPDTQVIITATGRDENDLATLEAEFI